MSSTADVERRYISTRDYNHATDGEYKRLRDLAQKEHERRGHLVEQSKQCYQNGDGEEAKRLSNEAKKHGDKMDEYNRQAAEYAFRENNADSHEDEIDLHGLYVKEAIEILETRISACKSRGDSHLDVIVGKGLHSEHGAKIKPAVQQLCQKNHFKYAIDKHNAGVIVIDFTGSGGEVDWNEVARPDKPHKLDRPTAHGQPGGYPSAQNNHYPQQSSYPQQQQQQTQQQESGGDDMLQKIFCGIFNFLVKKFL
ncbi:hypothetical protein TRVA0_018S02696 [Trichomonascus vanleenenianus]|uniref:Smr domain-containing protein n=1 Tax=Trichomonascus vanleenenianus TaxID=2268995 RepID=UPI003ECA01A0